MIDPKIRKSVGLLLIGHGTTNPSGRAEFLKIASLTQSLASEIPVEAAFLELAEPSIPAAIDRLVQHDVKRIVAVPLMLLAAKHVQQDIPEILAQKCRENPEISIKFAAHLGSQTGFFELIKQRLTKVVTDSYKNTYNNKTSESKEAIQIVFVARGSHSLAAQQEMSNFACRLSQNIDLPVHPCYYSVATPKLSEMMEKLASQQPNLVVLVPHLLFEGKILNKVRGIYDKFAGRHPEIQWEITPHIGPSIQIAEIVLELFFTEV